MVDHSYPDHSRQEAADAEQLEGISKAAGHHRRIRNLVAMESHGMGYRDRFGFQTCHPRF
jgi:hypothetical protein